MLSEQPQNRSVRSSVIRALFLPISVALLRNLILAEEPALTFEKDVRPILRAQCFHCHGDGEERSGGLDARLVRLIRSGGDSGSAIVAGNPAGSLLWQRIEAGEMPPGAKKLSDRQKEIIRLWIQQGAPTARPEPENIEEARFSQEELSHWAWQPLEQPVIPKVDESSDQTPIDSFIISALRERGLSESREADRSTLIRRLTFALTGLPPKPADVEEFIRDESPDAWKQLVDRLLESPQFGVRWGRHWLDVAGYAETNGDPGDETPRPHAWRYRDYVVDAFNRNKPIDEFLVEQLAGDELIDGELNTANSRHRELLTATGFLRMAPDPTQSSNTLADRNMAVADSLKVVSSAMLGLTIGCAQCHDHKYDPIGIDDYYRFRAIFDPAFPLESWQQPDARVVDFSTAFEKSESARIEAEAVVREAVLNERAQKIGREIQESRLSDVPENVRAATREAVLTKPEQQTAEQKRLLFLYPMVKTVDQILGQLVEFDNAVYREFEKEREKIAELRATRPPADMVMATRERPGTLPVSMVFHRGNPSTPGDSVTPQEVMVLRRYREARLPIRNESSATTGRRLGWARQLTDGRHPLTSRVFVNRVWMHLFGRGLVATPGDFGISGERPSHPALLDWLAQDFMDHGWDQKRLHRMILTSKTYRQSSARRQDLELRDPENRLLGRMTLRRLDVEEIRDAVLSVAGQLDERLGGPSVPVTLNAEGKVVSGVRLGRHGIRSGVDSASGSASSRRSVFIQVQRKLPLNMLATFDQPDMNPNCEVRRPSTVATQSLWFLNDSELIQRSTDLARLLSTLHSDAALQIDEIFLRLFAQRATAEERQACLEFLKVQTEHFASLAGPADLNSPDPGSQAMAALCQTLLASNRFLYVD
jgi:hypothetical protein